MSARQPRAVPVSTPAHARAATRRPAPSWSASTSAATRASTTSLDELALLAESAGDVPVARVVARRKAPDAGLLRRLGQGRRAEGAGAAAPGRGGDLRPGAVARAAAQPRAPSRRRRRRPDDADPRDLRRARAEPRGQAAGRARAPAVPVDPAGAALEPPRAPARRHRHARRPGRGADRARPAHDRRAHQEHQEAAREGEAPAQHAAARARAQRDLSRLAGRLHERRQVDALQRAGQRRGVRRRPAVRHARHDDPPALLRPSSRRSRGAVATRSASSATCRTR